MIRDFFYLSLSGLNMNSHMNSYFADMTYLIFNYINVNDHLQKAKCFYCSGLYCLDTDLLSPSAGKSRYFILL